MRKKNMPEKYVCPFTDFGFKKLFGTESNKELLRSFLNAILDGEEHIESLTYLNPEKIGTQNEMPHFQFFS